ncbi:hypothetical protein CK938_28260 (plasmid) [Bacillus cereus]|nr:hypothetical protein CK938_28260 [Bacillus cereus]
MLTALVYDIQNKNTILNANTYKISKVIDEQNVTIEEYIKYISNIVQAYSFTSLVKIKFYGFWRKIYAQKVLLFTDLGIDDAFAILYTFFRNDIQLVGL